MRRPGVVRVVQIERQDAIRIDVDAGDMGRTAVVQRVPAIASLHLGEVDLECDVVGDPPNLVPACVRLHVVRSCTARSTRSPPTTRQRAQIVRGRRPRGAVTS